MFITEPSGFVLLFTTGELTGVTRPLPWIVEFAMLGGIFASLLLGLVCIIGAYSVSTRINYIGIDVKVPTRQ